MTTYTYRRAYAAHLGGQIVTVPDQIADSQREHAAAGTVFPARLRNGRTVRVLLDGPAYGLHSGGTGDIQLVREKA